MELYIQPPTYRKWHFILWGLIVSGSALFPSIAQALLTAENSLRIEANSGNLILGSEQAEIEVGEVYESVVLLWGNLEIRGQIKEVLVVSGKVKVHETAVVKEKIVITGGEFELLPGAKVQSDQILYRSPGPVWGILSSIARKWQENLGFILQVSFFLFFQFFSFLCGAIFFRYSTTFRGILVGRIFTQWWQNFAVASLSMIFLPSIVGLFILSIVGILFLPFFFLFLLLSFLLAYWGAALWVGHRLLPPAQSGGINYWGFALGLFCLQILWSIGYWPGTLVLLLLWMLAWGSFLRAIKLLWK